MTRERARLSVGPGSIANVAVPPPSPDAAQAHVLSHRDGTLLVTGAAGTGKTWVLRETLARLVEEGAAPERTVLVVRSRRARDAARAALLDRLDASLPGLQVLTVHGLAHKVVKEREGEPPQVLSAAEQFARVRELLAAQDPAAWPAYGHLLEVRGFADEVRQLLTRMQEGLRTPRELAEAGERAGLHGWGELARFASEYQDALDGAGQVDHAGLVQRAVAVVGAGPSPFDHVLMDDYQDTTIAAEALLRGLGADHVIATANPDAHVFAFQGTTDVPLGRFTTEAFPRATTVDLSTSHRAPTPPATVAWVAPHTSEEHAAIARDLRRRHVDEGVAWRDMAVIVRRQGAHLGTLLRALDDARIPRAVPERGLSLASEPATYPYVLALRWLVADPPRREELIEPLLTSDVVGLSPAAARGLIRVAKSTGPAPRAAAAALERTDGLDPEEAAVIERARATLLKAELWAGSAVQEAFKTLWEELPCSARLVEDGGQGLDAVVTLSDLVGETADTGDASVAGFLEALDAGEHGPGFAAREAGGADAVQVLTAHGAAGLEFDTVIVAGAIEGNFPSLTRPEPMFDLSALERITSRSERMRARLQDERRLFRMVLGRARSRVVLAAADDHPDELSQRSRFAEELGIAWEPVPTAGVDAPVGTREAAALWRRQLADPGEAAWRRLAALQGLRALGVDPASWWFQRSWTDTGRPLHSKDDLRLSYSRLSNLANCELQHVLGDELGLGRVAGFHAWVGKLVHGIIEDAEADPPRLGKTKAELLAAVAERWREREFPSKAVSTAFRRLVEERMLPNWWRSHGEGASLAVERYFSFPFEGVTIVGVIDRIGPLAGGGTRITDFKTGNPDHAPKAEESLQLGIYYLAVQECEELAPFRPVRAVELAFVKGAWNRTDETAIRAWAVTHGKAESYQAAVRATLAQLIAEKRRLIDLEVYRPNPSADCHWCEFKTLCPLFPQGQDVFPLEEGAR